MAQTIELWTDQIEDTGVVVRVYFHALVRLDNGDLEWHYWGTDSVATPPTGIYAGEPVVEHDYVQFPQAFNDLLTSEIKREIYSLACKAGMAREGLREEIE